jgi:phosphoribosylformylglycinamidine cyclo-ligase
MLPEGKVAVIRKNSYEVPAIFELLAKTGNIEEKMMYNTYNMGIGMMIAVDPAQADAALKALKKAGETAYIVGEITDGEKGITIC